MRYEDYVSKERDSLRTEMVLVSVKVGHGL